MVIGEIIEIVNRLTTGSVLTEEDRDEDLALYGLGSLAMIKVILELEDKYHCRIPDAKVIYSQMNTIGKLYDIMREVLEDSDCDE